jgi:two-component system CheB/CheR fusion protein
MQRPSETKVENEFSIVGIGASAGGLDPIRKLLELLPTETGMAFVVIQHLAPGQESMLPEILSRSTQMKVQQVKDGLQVEKNQVYVITPGTTMTLKNGFLRVVPKGVALKPINDFMVSLASERKTQAIGIVLSGTGNDGTEGLKAIKVEGGITFVQDPETAQYDDMPKNAIAAETAYFILSPENMAKELIRLAKNPQLASVHLGAPRQDEGETDLKRILMMLKASSGVDFTHYKETTISRRIARRMAIKKIENKKEYGAFLRAHPKELQALFDDLLIGVTCFFREPQTFEALREKVFPELVKKCSANESIRVWIPGCSTGEEVYSVAIAIQEFLEEKALPEIRVQIFGTDANEKKIEKARQGVYPKTIADNVSENRLRLFFSSQNGNYQIAKLIRDMCIFAKQDITSDPPFSNLNLIMCRNVLIYFDSLLHERVFPIFHYGLKPDSFLVLGESESIGKFSYLFEQVTTKGLIYKKNRSQTQAFLHPEIVAPYVFQRKTGKQPEKSNSMLLLKEEVDRLLMAEFVPATLLVSNNLDILFFHGQVNPYLTHDPGTASLNVTKMIRKELRNSVQTAIFLARKEKKYLKEIVEFKQEGQQKRVCIQVKPLKTSDYEDPFFLVIFEEPSVQGDNLLQENDSAVDPGKKKPVKDKQIIALKRDLESTELHLQAIIEVQEATNEELRSTMEEAQSGNEELQSTNEELETAKEELQSGNEELQTLNEELKNRNLALGRLNDDLANLQINIDLPVIIVDNDLKIRRFTASTQDYLKISPSDLGQPITDVNVGVRGVDLKSTILDVITRLSVVNREVELKGNILCEMKIRPYLTEDKKIDGAVLSFTDITERKKIEQGFSISLKKAQQSGSEISALLKASRAVLKNKEFPDSARAIFNACKELIGATAGYVALLSNDGKDNEVLFLDAGGLSCTVDSSLPMPIRGLRAEVYNSGKVVFENDFSKSEWQEFFPKGHVQLKNVLFAPLTVDSRIVGVIGLANKIGEFTKRDAEMAMAFGEIASVALANSKIMEILEENEKELRMHSEHLETLVEERTRELKISERLAAIGATAGMVGHDIRNPLQAITSDVYLAKTDLASIPESSDKNNALESLSEIEKNVSYINKIVQDLQDYAKPLTMKLEETNLEQIVQVVLAALVIPENITVTYSIRKDFPKLKTDQSYMQRILTNLSNNGVQAMPKGGKLTIAAFSKNGKAAITVQDTGEGIPESVRNKIFTPLVTTKAKGQGFGLSVVKRFTEAMGGTVTFESEVGKGTKFIIELPL